LEALEALEPLLGEEPADTDDKQISAHSELAIEAKGTPILFAAFGQRMLRFADSLLQETTLGQCGPRTISNYILQHFQGGAEIVNRDTKPRVMALVKVCVTDNFAGVKAVSREISEHYQAIS
tara:strand:- start:281 stop:646 length:366 start_codon:yes stop_codon:yes gene_type:complete